MGERENDGPVCPQPYEFGREVSPTSPMVQAEGTDAKQGDADSIPDNPRNTDEVVRRGVVNVANPSGIDRTGTKSDAVSPGVADAGEEGHDRKIRTYKDMIDRLDPIETEEQRVRRERREKSARIVSAVSDGLRALSNLFFTTRYAPNMYNHEKGSQLNSQNAAIEKARKEREENLDRHMRYSMLLGDAETEKERMELARQKAHDDHEAHGWEAALQPDKQREQAGKATKAEQEAITAQAEAENAPALQQAKLATEEARAGSYNASAANSRASAASHGRANQAEFTAYDEKGGEHKFRTKDAAEAYARQHGTWHEEEYEETTDTHTEDETNGNKDVKRTTKKKRGYSKKPGKDSPTAGGGKSSPTA